MQRTPKNPIATITMLRPILEISLALTGMLTACGGEPIAKPESDVASTRLALSCSGSGCSGLDPELTGCGADARTLASQSHSDGGQVELRWSKACGTKWAKVTRAGRYETSAWLQTVPYDLTTIVTGSGDDQVSRLMWGNMSYSPGGALSACTYITHCRGGCGLIDDYACTALVRE